MRSVFRRRSVAYIWVPAVSSVFLGLACGQADNTPVTESSAAASTTTTPTPSVTPSPTTPAQVTPPANPTPNPPPPGPGTPPVTPAPPAVPGTNPSPPPVATPPSVEPTATETTTPTSPSASETDDTPLPAGDVPKASGLEVTANPNNVLSCIVTWTTDVDATSEVRFGVAGYQFVIKDETPTKEHRVVVIGMRAQNDYDIQAASSTSSGSATLEGAFTTGNLPNQVVKAAATTFEAGALQDGWTLTNLMNNGPAVIVMYDMEGEPVWYYVNGDSNDGRGDVSADLVDGDHVLIGPAPGEPPREIDLEGKIVWEGPNQGGEQMTHHAGKLSNGNYGVIRDVRDQGAGLQGTQVDEITPDNDVVWSWNIFDHLTPKSGSNMDWCHGNSVTFDFENDSVYLNCRFLGIIKIKYSTKDVEWGMGGTFDSTSLLADFTYTPAQGQFSDLHHPKYAADGNILAYDNGGFSQAGGFGGSAGSDFHSRVIEYAVDAATGNATVVWEFPGAFTVDSWFTQEWYSPYWGDADRLENGNILIDGAIRSTSKKARIFEVAPDDGKVLWQIELPTNVGTYRAERLSPPPLVQPYTAQ